MSFDTDTRTKLAKLVTEARKLLAAEFTAQLQEKYGIHPDGTIMDQAKLTHLDDEECAVAALLRERIEHLVSSIVNEKNPHSIAIERLIREQAFTLLNRFAALRMCEERELIQECLREGMNSRGFLVYLKTAGTSLGGHYDRYRAYLNCICDEIAVDLGVLFDRFSPFGLLFPREQALVSLLGVINREDLKHIWVEDETIGWVYQYFNPPEERKAMRDASRAPRNSRELAVRNQFFTPRYVVEFLTDNTLGRIWYEMRKGDTVLKDECPYLIRRPNEIFLSEGERAPTCEKKDAELSQEELLKKPVYIEHRPKKDPRDLCILDPACGSGHFLLYAFDLMEQIYQEAWEDRECPKSESTNLSLWEEYETLYDLQRAVPNLVIENNLHGIDIDPRAVQIATLALWLRAQKTWQNIGIKAIERTQIMRSNIVTAEPMPGEEDMLKEFVNDLKPRVLGQIVEIAFNKMKLAGEAGSLLKIEEEISDAVNKAKNQWFATPKPEQGILFAELDKKKLIQGSLFDVSDVTDEDFWSHAETNILTSLKEYAEQAEDGGILKRRLFAEDTTHGFAFIDLCRKHYDVVFMNPPFGEASKGSKSYIDASYPRSKGNLLANFLDCGAERLNCTGMLGAIVSRTCFFLRSFSEFRTSLLTNNLDLHTFVDLGVGILDAMVETAATVWSRGSRSAPEAIFFRELILDDKESALIASIENIKNGSKDEYTFLVQTDQFRLFTDSPYVYWVNWSVIKAISEKPTIDPAACSIRVGLQTGDDFRFLRIWSEVPSEAMIFSKNASSKDIQNHYLDLAASGKTWAWYSKTDKASPFLASIHLCVNWRLNGGEIKAYHEGNGHSASKYVMSENLYFRPGFSYMLRSIRLVPYIVPIGTIPTAGRSQIYPIEGLEDWLMILLATNLASAVSRFRGENFNGPKFQNTMVGSIPFIKPKTKLVTEGLEIIDAQRKKVSDVFRSDESEILFIALNNKILGNRWAQYDKSSLLGSKLDEMIAYEYGISGNNYSLLERDLLEAVNTPKLLIDNYEEFNDTEDSHLDVNSGTEKILSYALGCTFGRWDIRYTTGERLIPELPGPFEPLPICPPGMLQNEEGLPLTKDNLTHLQIAGKWYYPIEIQWDGILVDDPKHPMDIGMRVRQVLEVIWKDNAENIEQEACNILGVSELRDYFRKPSSFFQDHLKHYTKSRRKAPIYWPLSTESSSYTLWVYYHRLNDQKLYACVTDYVDPKIKEVTLDLERIQKELQSESNLKKRQQLEYLMGLRQELIDFRDELLRVAKLPYKPNLNDGVLITASPLWKLFRHNTWRKDLKACWEELEVGNYDWSHLAYTIWPDRVREKCRTGRSLAIAHNLEELYEAKEPVNSKTRKKKKGEIEE